MAVRLLSRREVQDRIKVGRTTLFEMVDRGEFPQPVRVRGRITAWPEDDVINFINSRPRVGQHEALPNV